MNSAIGCPNCESENTIRHGVRKNKHKPKQVYFCNSCSRFFSLRTDPLNSIYGTEIVSMVMGLFCRGYKYDSIVKITNSILDTSISKSTVNRWVQKLR